MLNVGKGECSGEGGRAAYDTKIHTCYNYVSRQFALVASTYMHKVLSLRLGDGTCVEAMAANFVHVCGNYKRRSP
jgi:hypothetical protein